MLYFARGRNPGKMQKTLAKVRLPGAGSPVNQLIANELARALAPGKSAPGTTPGKMCLHNCRFL